MRKIVCLVLSLVLLLCAFPMAVSAADDEVVVLAGSDFQVSDYMRGEGQINAILRRMSYEGLSKFDGLLFCGDYTLAMDGKKEDSVEGYDHLINALDSRVGDHRVFVQGNHDPVGCQFLSPSGANDAAAYGVFVINEADYRWGGANGTANGKTVAKAIAAKLDTYLKEKIDSGYNKPIFVVSHVPLHYSFRTKTAGDSDCANYIFDVLNAAGDKLNIFFLFGHNHSNGWDDYLGGAAIYLKRGDSINIAQASTTVFKEETLKFTYMNAGYTGYYNNHNEACEELTMTAFRIKGNEVIVSRHSRKGTFNLKAAGVRNAYKNEEGYAVNTDVYQSPRLVTLGGDVKTTTTVTKKATTTAVTTTAKTKVSGAGLIGGVTTQGGVVTVTTTKAEQPTTVAGAATTTIQLADVTTTVLPDTDGSTEVNITTTTVAESITTTPTTVPSQSTAGEPEPFPTVTVIVIAAAVLAVGAVVVILPVRKKKTTA